MSKRLCVISGVLLVEIAGVYTSWLCGWQNTGSMVVQMPILFYSWGGGWSHADLFLKKRV